MLPSLRLLLLLLFPALLLAGWPARAGDGPAEPPPAGFAGRQYIDSRGCVFVREGEDWVARLDPAGGPVCGYPPTQTSREAPRPAPALAGDPAPLPPGMGRIEAELLQAVASEMRDGDFVAAGGQLPPRPQGPAVAPDGDPAMTELGRTLGAAVAVAPQLSAVTAGMAGRDSRLCALIGAGPPGGIAAAGLGGTALGQCGAAILSAAATTPVPVAEIVSGGEAEEEGSEDAAELADAGSPDPAVPEPAETSPDATKAGRPAAAGTQTTVAHHDPAETPPSTRGVPPRGGKADDPIPSRRRAAAASGEPVIPAGARYFILGHAPDEAAARAAAARLVAQGFPAALGTTRGEPGAPAGTGPRTIMAGPFEGREAMVRALDRLRRAGYDSLVPR